MARTHSLMILPEEIRQCEALFSTPRTDFQMIIMQAHDMNKTTCKLFVIPSVFFRALQFTSIIIGRLPSWIGPISRNIFTIMDGGEQIVRAVYHAIAQFFVVFDQLSFNTEPFS